MVRVLIEMRSIGNYGVSDSESSRPMQTRTVRVAPDDCIVRCKGAGGYAQNSTEFYVRRKADPHTEVHDHSTPNFAITEGSGSLGACTPENRRTRTDTSGEAESRGMQTAQVTSLFQTDCLYSLGGVRRRASPGGGPGRYTSQVSWSQTGATVADAHS